MTTTTPIRLLVHGVSGRMGRALLRLASNDPRFSIAAAVSRSGDSLDTLPVLAAARIATAPEFDVMVDFSVPAAFDAALQLCLQRGCAFVSGTTGLSETRRGALDAAAVSIPCVWAANFSIGVAVLDDLVQRAATALRGWDCDIIETHHTHKRDAPSGTALALGSTIASAGGGKPHFASLRAGDIVGEHVVQFTGTGERIELIHRATDRDIFARGALEAAARIAGQQPGRYGFGKLLLR